MSSYYVANQTDCMRSIALQHGFASWEAIYEHAQNVSLRKLRPDPTMLVEGDKVFIPDRVEAEIPASTDKSHQFIVASNKVYLCIYVEDYERKPLKGTYRLEIAGVPASEGPIVDGKVSCEIQASVHSGVLVVQPKDTPPSAAFVWELKIGGLDPLNTIAGKQARMWNLGFECGPVDNIYGPLTKGGTRNFQEIAFDDAKEWDGAPGPNTEAKFLEHHRV